VWQIRREGILRSVWPELLSSHIRPDEVNAAACSSQWHSQLYLLHAPERSLSNLLHMNLENGGSSVLFINTDTAIFSKTSRRAARSHAAAVSRQREKIATWKLKPGRDHLSADGYSSRYDDSTVFHLAESEISPRCNHTA
jgi:hypothetical protein